MDYTLAIGRLDEEQTSSSIDDEGIDSRSPWGVPRWQTRGDKKLNASFQVGLFDESNQLQPESFFFLTH